MCEALSKPLNELNHLIITTIHWNSYSLTVLGREHTQSAGYLELLICLRW